MSAYDNFRRVASAARAERTEPLALELLALYAESKCATYPADSDLFRELWPDEKPPGFALHHYSHMDTHTVTAKIYVCPYCGPTRSRPDSCCAATLT